MRPSADAGRATRLGRSGTNALVSSPWLRQCRDQGSSQGTYAGATTGAINDNEARCRRQGTDCNDVLDALSSNVAKFRTATSRKTATSSGLAVSSQLPPWRPTKGKNAIFNRVASTTSVRYGNTKYTRFGAWNRVASTDALAAPAAPAANAAGVFAYSPLAATTYAVNDPNYPGGGSATYEGTTIARGNDSDNTYYEGNIGIDVTWTAIAQADGTPETNVGTIAASINDLRNSKGALYMNDAAAGGTDYGVATIVLAGGTPTNITRAADGSLSFTSGDLATSRLRHTNLRIGDDTVTTTINGMFVGKVIDGPLGIIGSWTLTNPNGDNLAGAYGADLQP